MADGIPTYEVAIVGAGPIGLELAVGLKKAGVAYVHFDAGQVGQTISWYPRQVRFFSSPERISIAGMPLVTVDQSKASREDYLAYLRGVVDQFDLEVRTFECVTSIRRDQRGGKFMLQTDHKGDHRSWVARRVVLAVGDMHRPRRLEIPGEDLLHVSHYFDEPHQYFRQKLLIVGGRNSAAEAAIRCWRAGAQVSLSYRREEFDSRSIKYWILPELQSLIKAGQIAFFPSTRPKWITADQVQLVPVGQTNASQSTTIDVDFVLAMIGYEMDTTLFEMAGVELNPSNQAPLFDPQTMQTNVPDLFVAGTAAAGTQTRFKLFIENCHPHVIRLVKAITGKAPDPGLVNDSAKKYALPES